MDKVLSREISSQAEGELPTTNELNTEGWVLKTVDPDGTTVKKTYDLNGRVIKEEKTSGGKSEITTYEYTPDGKLKKQINPDGTSLEYTYDAFSRTIKETHKKGEEKIKEIETSYDSLSRVVATTDTLSDISERITYATQSNNKSEVRTLFKDAELNSFYNETELETTREASFAGITLTLKNYSRTPSSYLSSFTLSSPSTQEKTYSFDYDSTGKLTSFFVPGLLSTATLSYNSSQKLTTESIPLSFDGNLLSTYAYQEGGRLLSATISGITYSYTITSSGFITRKVAGSTTTNFTQSTTYTGAVLSFEEGARQVSFSYDSFGKRTKRKEGTNITEYFYSGERLTTVTASGKTIVFSYDAEGQRKAKKVGGKEVSYTYRGLILFKVEEKEGTTDTVIFFVYDEREKPVAFISKIKSTTTDTAYPVLLTSNSRGDILELLDKKGEAFARYSYDPYGKIISTKVKATSIITTDIATYLANVQPLRFASYVYDTETGLYYLSQRYYDPETMQFLTKDPEKADGEESGYQYCGGDPVNSVDPSGTWGSDLHYKWTYNWARNILHWSEVFASYVAMGARDEDFGGFVAVNLFFTRLWSHFNWYERTNNLSQVKFGVGNPDSRRTYAEFRLRQAKNILAKERNYTKALYVLGMGVHALQDSWAHGTASLSLHLKDTRNWRAGRHYYLDNPNWKTWRVEKTREETIRYLKRFLN